jgi:hypothetical protein
VGRTGAIGTDSKPPTSRHQLKTLFSPDGRGHTPKAAVTTNSRLRRAGSLGGAARSRPRLDDRVMHRVGLQRTVDCLYAVVAAGQPDADVVVGKRRRPIPRYGNLNTGLPPSGPTEAPQHRNNQSAGAGPDVGERRGGANAPVRICRAAIAYGTTTTRTLILWLSLENTNR